MRRCPQCSFTHKSLKVFGWLVYGEANLMIIGDQESISQIVPHIALNEQGFKDKAKVECNKCGYTGPLNTFVPIQTCFLTGAEASQSVELFGRTVWIADAAIEDVRILQNVNLAFDWELLNVQD